MTPKERAIIAFVLMATLMLTGCSQRSESHYGRLFRNTEDWPEDIRKVAPRYESIEWLIDHRAIAVGVSEKHVVELLGEPETCLSAEENRNIELVYTLSPATYIGIGCCDGRVNDLRYFGEEGLSDSGATLPQIAIQPSRIVTETTNDARRELP